MDENEGIGLNIFFLDTDPVKAAQYQCDKHVVKMVLETAQLLSSVHYFCKSIYNPEYKLTHKNHPCAIWARTSVSNYVWLCRHGLALCDEYTFRYGKVHKSQRIIEDCFKYIPSIANDDFTEPPQAMPEQYKRKAFVEAYRSYYIGDKLYMANWKKREMPDWIVDVD